MKEITAALDALEAVLEQNLWTPRERERLIIAVMQAILIKRRRRRKSNK